jgi:hypothetical protein
VPLGDGQQVRNCDQELQKSAILSFARRRFAELWPDNHDPNFLCLAPAWALAILFQPRFEF